jgi:hypothetical protein
VADLDERLEAAEDALLDLAADYLASGNDPSRRPSEDEMYRDWIHHTLEVLAALHGQTPQRKWLSRRSSTRPRARSGRVVMRAG